MAMARSQSATSDVLTVFLCGDVMLGRGIDQVLPHPGAPALREHHMRDARDYVGLAEAVNGAIDHPVDWSWPWGDALPMLESVGCDVRIVNLETSITTSDDFAPRKGVHYRMHPTNLPALEIARPDVCVLANNHVLDFGHRGFLETLDVLSAAGLRTAGAGRFLGQAQAPGIVALPRTGGRVIVYAFGTPSSGIPVDWVATGSDPGICLLPKLSAAEADQLTDRARRLRQPGDLLIASVHWGSNWGYDVEPDQVRFAHRLIEGGFDIVHGHSSHHPRPVEVYRGKLILYGCGDLIDDYEGIRGYEQYRDDLRLVYLADVEATSGQLLRLRLMPFQARQLRLHRAPTKDAEWLQTVLDKVSRPFGTRIALDPDSVLTVRSQ